MSLENARLNCVIQYKTSTHERNFSAQSLTSYAFQPMTLSF